MADDKQKPEQAMGFMCGQDSFHPYECRGPKKCPHCRREKIEGHDPKDCALCEDGLA